MSQDPTDEPARPRLWDHIRLTYDVIRANPVGDLAVKISIAVLGGLIVAVGIVLIPLPGPGWLIVLLGLAIWAAEFVWARHVLRFTREKLRSWTHWVGRQSVFVRLLIGVTGLILAGLIAAMTLKYSFGIDLLSKVWHYITTH